MNTRLLLTLALLAPVSRAASPLEDGTAANVWVLDANGSPVATYRVGADFTTSAAISGGGILATALDGTTLLVPGTTASSDVLVNALNSSVPLPLLAPPMSVVGVTAALNSSAAPASPTVDIRPAAGVYTTTTRVTIDAYPSATGSDPVELYLTVGSDPEFLVEGTSAVEVFVLNGDHTITARVVQGTVQVTQSATYTLDGTQPKRRDTDGDGIPDFVEKQKGLDPFRDDTRDDRDGDGWTDWDEVLRGLDADSPGITPEDTDGDGWSDWDEELRGTLTGDAISVPVASTLYGVEYNISGSTFDDAAGTVPTTDEGLVVVRNTLGRVLGWAVGAGRTSAAAAEDPAVLSVGDPILMLGEDFLDIPLATFGPIRVAGDTDLVVLAAAGRRTKKAWLTGSPEVLPSEVAAQLEAESADWVTVSDYLEVYEAELAARLVIDATTVLHTESALGVALVEAVLGWTLTAEPGGSFFVVAPVRLGEPSPLRTGEAVSAVPWGGTLAEVAALGDQSTFSGGVDAVAVRATLFAAPDSPTDSATDALALRLQQPEAGTETATLAYQSRLIAFAGRAAVDGFVPLDSVGTDPWRPGDDADSDGLSNEAELAAGPLLASDPLYPDSDDDGRGDLGDPCPTDASDACLEDQSFATDVDHDGVLDAIDNCFGTFNPTQEDTNGDLIGDACNAAARIAIPVANLEVLEGSELTFTSMVSGVGAVSYEWFLDGSSKGTGDSLTFTASSAEWGGSVVVELWTVLAPGKILTKSDERLVRILSGDAPVPCLALDCSDSNACSDDSCDLDLGCINTPIPGCKPCDDAGDCDDGATCTTDACLGGVCVNTARSGPACDDGNACTTGDKCLSGLCAGGTPTNCDDGDPCTVESCVAPGGCVIIDDPTPDPILCPECATDADCAAGSCTGGVCCIGNMVIDTPFVWNPGDPTPSICIEAGVEFSLVLSTTVAGSVKLKSPAGVSLASSSSTKSLFAEVESAPLPGAYTVTLGHSVAVTLTFFTGVDEEDVVPAFGTAFTTPIGTVGAEVYQRFNGTAGMRVSVRSIINDDPCNDVSVLNPDGTTLWTQYSCGTQFSDAVTLPVDGEYAVYADPTGATASGVTTTIWQLPADPVVVVTAGGPTGNLPLLTPGLNGSFQFVASVGDRLALQTNNISCTNYDLLAPSGVNVVSEYSCGALFVDPVILAETGTYTWTVNPVGTGTGTSQLTTYLLPADPVVAASVGGGTTSLDLPYPGLLGTAEFSVVATARVAITFTKAGTMGCTTYTLKAPSGATAWSQYSCGTPFMDATDLTETGTYALTINPGNNGSGNNTFNIIAVPANAAFAGVIGGPVVATANTVVGQNIDVTFTGAAGQNFAFTGAPGSKSVAYTLTDPAGAVVHTGSKIGSYTSPTLVLGSAGTYRLTVNPNGADVLTVNVTLTSPP